MNKKTNHRVAIFYALLLISIVVAPTVILSMDETVDVAVFYGENEEEKENIKLLIETPFVESDNQAIAKSKRKSDGHTFKKYPKPHLNLISPPPDLR